MKGGLRLTVEGVGHCYGALPVLRGISLTAEPGEVVSVQVTYDRGWKAAANGHPAPITRDGIGLMVLHPDCQGRCEIDMSFDGGLERKLCWVASLLVMLGTMIAVAYRVLGRRVGFLRPRVLSIPG